MKLIEQSFEILKQEDYSLKGIKKFIERCGRVCYKSEANITNDSYIKFVDNLEKLHHDRPLEFGTVHLIVPKKEWLNILMLLVSMKKLNCIWVKWNLVNGNQYVTLNYRYYTIINNLIDDILVPYFTEENNEYFDKRYTVHMVLDRQIMDEFRTHITLSHLGESTRYCNYSKAKFGDEVTFIVPNWVNTHCPNNEHKGPSVADIAWSDAMRDAETSYFLLLNEECKPQQACKVLPLGTKSELISCGFEDAWDNFFYRRCAPDAHPMAREIATKIKEKIYE